MDRILSDYASALAGLTANRLVKTDGSKQLETPAALTSDQSLTLTNASGITTLQAATQDGIRLLGRAGGTSGFFSIITTAALTASRTLTLPDANTTITGGGTVALGGFTLTVPATGTAGLLGVANTWTLANTFSATTSASSSTTGTVIVGNGTAATTVGIGGGNVNAGGTITASASSGNGTLAITSTNPSTSTVTGSVITQGGYSALRQSFFRGLSASGDPSALAVEYYHNQSVDPAAFRFALNFTVSCSGATAGNSGTSVGIQSDFSNNVAGITHADVRAFSAIINTGNATAAITNGYGYYFRNGTNTGTSTNKHAFYTEAITGGTNNYAFRSAGAGLVSIGDTTDATSSTAAAVTLAGGLAVAKAAYIGTALNLPQTTGTTLAVSSTNQLAVTVAGGVRVANGTIANPSLSFAISADTGITYSSGIAISHGGIRCVTITDTLYNVALNVISTFQDTTEASGTATAAVKLSGGLGVAKRSYLGTIGGTFKGNVLAGVQDATAVVTGQVGEELKSTVSAVAAAATGTVGNVTSISLTAGDWLISGYITTAGGATGLTAATAQNLSIVTTTATNGTLGDTMQQQTVQVLTANGLFALAIPAKRVNISATTTYYLTSQVSYTAGSPTHSGTITATRVR